MSKESINHCLEYNPNYKWSISIKPYNDCEALGVLKNGGFKRLTDAGIEFGTSQEGMSIMSDDFSEIEKAIEVLNELGIKGV